MTTAAHDSKTTQTLVMPGPLHDVAIAVDGTDAARDAIALGVTIAAATSAEALLVGVYSAPMLPALSSRELRSDTRAELARLRDELAPAAAVTTTSEMSVARGLARVVRTRNAGLLVVGSNRHAADGETRIGPHARQLLERVACALAVAPRGWQQRDAHTLSTIGVGYDRGPEAAAALQFAATLARSAGARLHVRAVVDERLWAGLGYPARMGYAASLGDPAPIDWQAVIDDELANMRAQVTSAVRGLDCDVDTDVVSGLTVEQLRSLSRSVDLLVIGSRRWGAIARVVSGSTGEGLLHSDTTCPVVIVPRARTSAS